MNTLIATALLTFTHSNGTVAPEYQRHYTCNIYANTLTKKTDGGVIYLPNPIESKTQYNQEIPNVTVLKSLILEASRFTLQTSPEPIGGEMSFYTATLPTKAHTQIVLRNLAGNLVIKNNSSPAAKKLVNFMNQNCNSK